MSIRILHGDCRDILKTLPDASVHCVVTSPPYFGLRDYGVDGQIGLEASPDAFVAEMVAVFREVRRVLRDDGTLWLNLGDSYSSGGRKTQTVDTVRAGPTSRNLGNDAASGKQEYLNGTAMRPPVVDGLGSKQLLGMPWRVALAMQADGWILRQDIIWHKPNPMPESVTDRCTKSHEYVFLMSKSARYFYDAGAIREEAIYSGLTGQDASGFKNPMNFNGKHAANPEIRGERATKGQYSKPYKGAAKKDYQAEGVQNPSDIKRRIVEGKMAGTIPEGRNARSVWTIATQPFKEAHFATFPPDLAERCIKAGCPAGGVVLDPFAALARLDWLPTGSSGTPC